MHNALILASNHLTKLICISVLPGGQCALMKAIWVCPTVKRV